MVGWYGNAQAITINKPPKGFVPATVSRVVDGDTVEVTLSDGTKEKVRLIGMDTPETVHPTKPVQSYGPEASDYTKAQLTGKEVVLEYDVEERDKYGRLLAYVYLPSGTMFNATLVDEGYAQLATFPPNVRYVGLFRTLQTEARTAAVGLWGLDAAPAEPDMDTPPPVAGASFPPDASGNCNGMIKGNHSSSGEWIYHAPGGQFYAATKAEECFTTPEAAQAAGYRASKR